MGRYDDINGNDILHTAHALDEAGEWDSNLTGETLVLIDRNWGYFALMMNVHWEGDVHPNWETLYDSIPNRPLKRPRIKTIDDAAVADDILVYELLHEAGVYESDLSVETLVKIYRKWGHQPLLSAVRWHKKYTLKFLVKDPTFIEEPHARYMVI